MPADRLEGSDSPGDSTGPPRATDEGAGRIALIRHGQTTWSRTGRHTSVTDVDLTPTGEREARTIAVVLRGLRLSPATVLVSPRLRARWTAVLAGLDEPEHRAAVTDDLVEWDYGRYEGLTTPQIRDDHPGWDLFADGCPGGESPDVIGRRADRLLTRVRTLTERGDVALVCHGHISRTIAVRWVGLPVAAGALLAMDAAAVTVLGTYHGGPIIEHANVVPFAREPSASGRQ